MIENKIFAGPKVKRIRLGLSLSQTDMAKALEISPSYLNLIERNQRPLTVQLLLKLSSVFDINPDQLSGDGDETVTQLKEAFSDPLLQGELAGYDELFEMADASPNVASGILKLHKGYREALSRLSDLNRLLSEKSGTIAFDESAAPADRIKQLFESKPYFFEYLDQAAENFATQIKSKTSLHQSLIEWLFETHRINVQTLPIETMAHWRRRFDRHSMRLFISERLNPHDQLQELASEVASIALEEQINEEVRQLQLKDEESQRLARIEFTRYAALSIMLPYSRFLQSAKRSKFDLDVLAGRFNVSFEHVANRLSCLARKKAKGPAFFMLEIDHAGNIVRRSGRDGFPLSKFGGSCPKLISFSAFAQPNRLLVETVEMASGNQYLTLAKTLDGPTGAFGVVGRKTALLIGLEQSEANQTIYDNAASAPPTEIGTECRLCEREACMSRAAAPLARTLAADPAGSSISSFDFRN